MDIPTNTNILNNISNIQNPIIFYFLLGFILLCIVAIALIYTDFKVAPIQSPAKSAEEIVGNVFIVVFFLLIVFGISVWLVPGFKDLKQLFLQISNVTYVIVYTIAAIVFYLSMSKQTLDQYAKYINPVVLLIGMFAFYRALSHNYMSDLNIHYERIKMLILLFCIITLSATFYNINPGGAASTYFGYSLLITIIASVFAFLYLMILVGFPDTPSSNSSLLSGFSSFGVYGTFGLIAFVTIITALISSDRKQFFKDKAKSGGIILLTLIVCILASLMLVANTYGSGAELNNNIVKKSLLILFGFVLSGLFIFWLSYNIEHLSGKSGITSFVLNMLLVTVILGLIYQTIFAQLPYGNAKKNAFFGIFSNMFYYLYCLADSKQNAVSSLLINSLFYIPCLVSELFRGIAGIITGQGTAETTGSWIMLLTAIMLFVAYFKTPTLLRMLNTQGGKLLVNQPVSTDTQHILGNYIQLNGSDSFDYQYAISCWIYIDAAGANMNANYNKYTSILNFGNKPNVLYNGKKHSLMITMNQKDAKRVTHGKLVDTDDEGNRILYVNDQFLLQKWNNLILNYNGGTMDIFLNGELVQSSIEVVPYYTLDNLTIGENNGIKGGICNVVYYKKPLNAQNIYLIYNTAKHMTPPIIDDSNETIIDKSLR